MQSLSESMADPRIPVVMESTGDFHMQSAILLREGGFAVKCINPLISKQLEKRDVRGAKTDKVDAGRLAKLGADEPSLADFTASRQDIWARKHVGTIAKMHKTIQQLSSALRRSEETAAMLGLPIDLSHLKNAIDELQAQIKASEAALADRCDPQFPMIAQETKGVSQKQMAILSAILAGKTFSDRDQLVAFSGLDVRVRQSGKWQGKQVLSKRGNPFLRRTLFLMGWGLALHNPTYQKLYRDKKQSGAHHYTCVIACARKFLRQLHSELYGRGAVARLSTDARLELN
jgi:transposase